MLIYTYTFLHKVLKFGEMWKASPSSLGSALSSFKLGSLLFWLKTD